MDGLFFTFCGIFASQKFHSRGSKQNKRAYFVYSLTRLVGVLGFEPRTLRV